MISYGKQSIDRADIDAVVDTLESDYLTQGPKVTELENALSSYVEAKYGVAVNSGTSALHIACLALGLSSGDSLWTSPITFVASANCGLYCGAKIDFVDVEPDTGNISAEALAQKLETAANQGALPKILVVVHFAGQSCDMAEIKRLSDRYGFRIIEDACHALGGRYLGAPIGSCKYSDITIFSFHPVKSMTSAEGGMAVTNDVNTADQMRHLASHGIIKGAKTAEPWGYQQVDLGYNYRMSDVHAALGLSQLSRLDEFIVKRNQLADAYTEAFAPTPIMPLKQSEDVVNAYHLYVVQVGANVDRKQMFIELRDRGVGVHVHYIPVYKQPYYQALGFSRDYCPGAEKYYEQALTLPLFPNLTAKDQAYVIDTVSTVLEKATNQVV